MPIFAFTAAAFLAAVAIFVFIFAGVERSPVGWGIGGLFATLSGLVFAALAVRTFGNRSRAVTPPRYRDAQSRPTLAILVLLLSIYSWMLTIGLRINRAGLAGKGIAEWKYNLTMGIAIASSLYLSFHGRDLIRRRFGLRGGRKIVVSPSQALCILLFILSLAFYLVWVMS